MYHTYYSQSILVIIKQCSLYLILLTDVDKRDSQHTLNLTLLLMPNLMLHFITRKNSIQQVQV